MERGLALFNYIKMHMIFDLALYILSVFKDIVAWKMTNIKGCLFYC